MKKETINYVDNEKLQATLVKYFEAIKLAKALGKDKPKIPDYIGECILTIANKYSTAGNWRNYSYREEMVSDAIENCLQYFENYDTNKYKNPLAYFTEICKWAFVRRIKKEQKQQYLKYKHAQRINLEHQLLGDEIESMSEEIQQKLLHGEPLYDNMLLFIEEFERKVAEKKAKTKKMKEGKGSEDEHESVKGPRKRAGRNSRRNGQYAK